LRKTKSNLSLATAVQGANVLVNAALLVAAAAVLAFYCNRIFMALPLYAVDEGAYLIRALVPPELVARYPYVADVQNPVFLAIIRLAHRATEYSLEWLRTLNLAAYVAGIGLVYIATTRGLPRREALGVLLLALAFPYYRFVVTALPEGWYVGLLGLVVLATAWWWRRRPLAHAAVAGALSAALVLTKPHGLAVMAALGGFILIDAVLARRGLVRTAVRLGVLVAAFLAVGNLLTRLLGADVQHPVLFFMSGAYSGILGIAPSADGVRLGVLNVAAMTAAVAMLAGLPLVLGLLHLARRWRIRRGGRRFELDGREAAFLLLILSLGATIAMVGIFAMKVANNPGETLRLWGRYFEFFVPMIWLAAARPMLWWDRQRSWPARLAAAGVVLLGLLGLLLSFRAGIALYPWDATAINAFFEPVALRTFDPDDIPYRAMAIGVTLVAVAAAVVGLRFQLVWTAWFVALGLLSTATDHAWVRGMVAQREAMADELHVLDVLAPGQPTVVVNDANEGHLMFLDREGAVTVVIGQPQQSIARFAGAPVVAVLQPRPAEPGWRRIYVGPAASIFQPETTPPAK
jgi:hypothetical protein